MLPVNLKDLTADHIQDLIDSEVAESVMLEYKQQLPSKQSDEKREFLYDVAAMANAAGGDIVFGIAERPGESNAKTGIADKVLGERWPNIQAEVIRLSSYIRDGIAPRLSGFDLQPISCPDGDALVVRIPSSWNKPHIVTIGGVDRFYRRTGATNNPMTVDEIRRAFSEQGELRENIARWRSHRAELIESGRGPVVMMSGPIAIFHVIPAEAFALRAFSETWRVPDAEKRNVYVPTGNSYQRYNADGFLCHSSLNTVETPPAVWGYSQLFRSGIVEYGFCPSFRHSPYGTTIQLIRGQALECEIVHCFADAYSRLKREGRIGAAYVGFSLIGIQGKRMFINDLFGTGTTHEIVSDTFSSPEIYVDLSEPEEDEPFARTLRPLVDTLWQVAGLEETPFRLDGTWKPFADYR